MISVLLPMPPSVNNLFVNSGRRGRRKSAQYAAWLVEAGWQIKLQLPGFQTITGPVAVDMLVGKMRGDLDNRCKPVLDLFTKQRIWNDDKQVAELRMARGDLSGVVVTFCEIKDQGVAA